MISNTFAFSRKIPSSYYRSIVFEYKYKRAFKGKNTFSEFRKGFNLTNRDAKLWSEMNQTKVFSKIILVKSSRSNFIFLPVFYLIMCLMKDPNFFEKIAILKIWELVSFWGVKTHFGKIPLKWSIFRHEKIIFLQYGSLIVIDLTIWSLYGIYMIFWSFFGTMTYPKDNFCFQD